MKFSNAYSLVLTKQERSALVVPPILMQFGSEIMLQQTRVAQGPIFSLSAAFPLFLIWLKPMKKRC
jgi:hypothetical protein